MHSTTALDKFWFSFPQDANMPFGIGVTAYSEADAYELMQERGVSDWFANAKEIVVQKNIRIQDLSQSNIVPNIGPMQLRGVWYPCMNIGYGAPKSLDYKPL
jgi:hypothetical protein